MRLDDLDAAQAIVLPQMGAQGLDVRVVVGASAGRAGVDAAGTQFGNVGRPIVVGGLVRRRGRAPAGRAFAIDLQIVEFARCIRPQM